MRRAPLLVLIFAGCGSGDFVPTGDGGAARDLAVAQHDAAQPGADLAAAGTDGGVGAHCMTACDCDPGLACINQACAVGIQPVYCCSSTDCPTGKQCQDDQGNDSLCGGTDGGGFNFPDGGGFNFPDGGGFNFPDGGGFNFPDGGFGAPDGGGFCQFIPCQNDQICKMVGCALCKNGSCSN